MEATRHVLERLVYRTEELLKKLEAKNVKAPIWQMMTLQRALQLAHEHQEQLDAEGKEVVLDKVRDVWYAAPELRFMQLLENVAHVREYHCPCYNETVQSNNMYYMTDEELTERLGEMYG